MSALDHATAYAARGWQSFVLSAEKIPLRNCEPCAAGECNRDTCTCLTCHGFYAATSDTRRLEAMFRRHPDNPVAIRTGAQSGIVVVEVDPKNGGLDTLARLDERGILPGTLMAQSGGGGVHLYYQHPGYLTAGAANKLGPGVDVKADGGYVVAPPSLHRSGHRYAWTGDGRHDYPLTPLHPEVAEAVRVVVPDQRREGGPGTVRGRFASALDMLLKAEPGNRNAMLLWAAQVAGEMIQQGALSEPMGVRALQVAAGEIGLSKSEIGDARRGTIGSGLRRGAGKVAAS